MSTRVVVVNLTPRGGMLHYASQFSNALSEKYPVAAIIADYYEDNLYRKTIPFFRIKTLPSVLNLLWNTLAFWRHIVVIMRVIRFHPTHIHFLDNHPWYIFYAPFFRLLGYKIYVTQHDPILHSGESTTLLGKVAAFVNLVLRKSGHLLIVHGDVLRNQVINLYGVNKERVISVPHGNYNFFADYSDKSIQIEKDTFLFFWRILEYKGLDILLKALHLLLQKWVSAHLLVTGAGDISAYQQQIEEVKNNVRIINRNIAEKEAWKFFEATEFTVLPYRDATGSGVIPVSYAFSRPVIATNVGWLPSAVVDGQTWVIVSPDPESVAQTIEEFLWNKEEVSLMWKKARQYTETVLGWGWIVKSIYK